MRLPKAPEKNIFSSRMGGSWPAARRRAVCLVWMPLEIMPTRYRWDKADSALAEPGNSTGDRSWASATFPKKPSRAESPSLKPCFFKAAANAAGLRLTCSLQ
ncbi:hypothetical protein D3C81_1581880 [compost metagenome]